MANANSRYKQTLFMTLVITKKVNLLVKKKLLTKLYAIITAIKSYTRNRKTLLPLIVYYKQSDWYSSYHDLPDALIILFSVVETKFIKLRC